MLNPLTTTKLRRENDTIYAIQKLIQSEKIDEYRYITNTLLSVYYELDTIIEELEYNIHEKRLREG